MNSRIWLVASREYRENVAKKAFWIGLILGPLFFGALITLQILSVKLAPEETRTIAIVNHSARLASDIDDDLAKLKFKNGRPEFAIETPAAAADSTAQLAELNRRIVNKSLFGFLWIGPDLEAKDNFRFLTRNVGSALTIDKIDEALDRAMVGSRLESRQLNLTREELAQITKGVRLSTLKIDEKGQTSKRDFRMLWLVSFVYLLMFFVPIIGYGMTALRGILEEKSTRVIEVLLSSVTPFDLFMGKVVGLALVGLTQVGAYALTGMAMSTYGAMAAPAGIVKDLGSYFSPGMMGLFLVYFLLGFFLFLSMFAAIGSMVNSEQEAQSMQQPVMWMLIIPMYSTFFFINNPDSVLARVVSMIPFFTPMVMIMRISIMTPPWWEIALSIVLMLLAILLVIRVGSRIFRVGVLMYGKKPSLPEIVRWAKSS